jgi:hypothetical protein
MTRSDAAGSPLPNIFSMKSGTICQDTPYLSFSQPHCYALLSPPAESLSQ